MSNADNIATTSTQAAAEPQPQRRKRASTGGFALKLDAPSRPGYVRRFVNGDPARLQHMQELGYSIVNDRPAEGNKRTDGLGTKISRHAGKQETGEPMQAYLMETPDHLYAEGTAEKEDARKPFEEAIRRGVDTTGELESPYRPADRSSLSNSG